jgi:hypothetical protein
MFNTRDHCYTECFALFTVIGMRTTSPSTSPGTALDASLDDLAHLIARDGIEAFESDITRLVVRLRTTGPATDCDRHRVLVQLLSDHSAPAVARERAFGELTGQLAGSACRTSDHMIRTAA